MDNYQESVSLETCLRTLIANKAPYGKKGLDMQIYFVAQLFHTSYQEIVSRMNVLEQEFFNSMESNNMNL